MSHILAGFDLVGLAFLLNRRPNIFVIGFGWSFAESVVVRLLPLWIGSKGFQFNYQYLQIGMITINFGVWKYKISISFLL
jgi:hypothetical protein